MDTLRQFWSRCAPRERALLAGGAAVLLVVLLYLLLIEPAWTGIRQLERSLPAARAQAAQLDSLLAEANALRARPQVAAVGAAEARAAIEKSLAAAGLKAARIQPLSEGDLQLSFAGVPYGTWSTWLAGIERDLGARAFAVTANRAAAPGMADIELALRLARR